MKTISIQDVANLAGVSRSTVSLVLNGPDRVVDNKREAVRRAMMELNYQPRRNRRRTENKRALGGVRQVALLFPDMDSRGVRTILGASLIHAVEDALNEVGIQLVVTHLRPSEKLPRCLENGSVEGVIVRVGDLPKHCQAVFKTLPCVTVLGAVGTPEYGDVVRLDNVAIGEAAARMLVQRGHRHLLQIEHYVGRVRNPSYACRQLGFEHAANSEGVKSECWLFDPAAAWPREAVERFLNASPRPTGIFGGNELFFEQLRDHGFMAGRDFDRVAVVPHAGGVVPSSESVIEIDMNLNLIAAHAVALLQRRIENPYATQQALLVNPALCPSGAPFNGVREETVGCNSTNTGSPVLQSASPLYQNPSCYF